LSSHSRGLEIVGLSSKNDADPGQALPQVESSIKGYGISTPIHPCRTILEVPGKLP
jgi:hypothetical protein